MAYTAKDYNNLIGMEGFSETLLKNHFTLYQGYVANTNKVFDTLSEMAKGGKIGTPEYAELKRRLGWEFNGMRLHELYFENLGGKGALNKAGKFGKKLAEEFGSYENWEADFKGVGAMRGIGGEGLLVGIQREGGDVIATVHFASVGRKRLSLQYAHLEEL